MTGKELLQIIFRKGDLINNFEVINSEVLEDIMCISYEMIHKKSGAKLIYLQTNDTENLFSIAFRTFPVDDTGLPHILEHTVLCGSKRYPVKDPFVELLKTSLATFLNAMTYPDKTVYPCASTNEQDFLNLVRVYCDAVFNPLITKEHFKQEGHHFNIAESDGEEKLTVEGVVYNEMKGVYSDMDGIIGREESRSIMPETIYGRDSGGNPSSIPDLTYEKFKRYHSKYYHPSNSYIIIYGSFEIAKTLQLLDEEFLNRFNALKLNLCMPRQPRWIKPVRKSIPYPVLADEKNENKTATTINFLTNPITDTITSLSMAVLEMYLLDNASSPLKKALMDSKLGEALTSSGYADYQHDTFFTVGLKGINPRDNHKIEKIILDTCKNEAMKGFDKNKVDAAFHKLFIDSKEIQSSYPLTIMERVYDYWLYDSDPLTLLKLNNYLKELKFMVDSKSNFLENILLKQIVNNKHYCTISFLPDPDYQSRTDEEFETKMKSLKASMSEENLLKIKSEAKRLEELQSKPNSPETLKTLPRLKLSDINKEAYNYPVKIRNASTTNIITSDIFSNGISYLDLAFDVSSLPEELFNAMALFKSIFLKMGTDKHSYTQMAELEASYTGGIASSLVSDGNFDNFEAYNPFVTIYSKCLEENFEKTLSILNENIIHCEFKDIKRLRELVLQKRTNLKSSILSAGSSYAVMYASKYLTKNMYLSEITNGISHLRYLNTLAENFDGEKEKLIENLYKIKSLMLNSNSLTASFIGTNKHNQMLDSWTPTLSKGSEINNPVFKLNSTLPGPKAILMPSSISYNSAVLKTVEASHPHAPALFLLSHFLTFNYLWEEIRVKKGAYGASTAYSMLNGTLSFSTYRDPCIKESYDTFRKSLDFICSKHFANEELELAIIGSLKKIDKPVRPEDAVSLSLNRHLRNSTENLRAKFRTDLLSLNEGKIKKAAETILKNAEKNFSCCTISGKKQLEKANSELNPKLIIETI
ncbi:MAG TPA: hypothetical protein DD381_10120 [Lentisphaeria bacterium]|nr:MAG: hypothetical protein A2X47_11895 [Lentisphaerae bacterium GWF2_38_69]HBM16680.1 hypothetical protein [Lentisphaeria bacterium]